MCFEDPSLTPEDAAAVLQRRFPEESYERILVHTRLIAKVREIVRKGRQST
jgi:hypothetical protein